MTDVWLIVEPPQAPPKHHSSTDSCTSGCIGCLAVVFVCLFGVLFVGCVALAV